MQVTMEHPTRTGQRVQEIFTDSRGRIVSLTIRNNEACALVDWDQPFPEAGADDCVFPLSTLWVVQEVRLDWDHYIDPGKSPMVTVDDPHNDRRRAVYTFPNGNAVKGISAARVELVKHSIVD